MWRSTLIDDLGYVQQSREEMEVLFTLLSERYERGSYWIIGRANYLRPTVAASASA
jgi:DNA replication protein DnaC